MDCVVIEEEEEEEKDDGGSSVVNRTSKQESPHVTVERSGYNSHDGCIVSKCHPLLIKKFSVNCHCGHIRFIELQMWRDKLVSSRT